jgi:hypothetical protein
MSIIPKSVSDLAQTYDIKDKLMYKVKRFHIKLLAEIIDDDHYSVTNIKNIMRIGFIGKPDPFKDPIKCATCMEPITKIYQISGIKICHSCLMTELYKACMTKEKSMLVSDQLIYDAIVCMKINI